MDRIFFTSDTHYGHRNIIKFGKGRPFSTIEEHDEALIRNWNERVSPGDRVYHLGDFSMAHPERIDKILARLVGQKFFIRGNHDKAMRGNILKHFVWAKDYFKLKVPDPDTKNPTGKQEIVLCHYPMEIWDKRHYGSWHLHGHCHGNLAEDKRQVPRFDVGVDCWDYAPVSYEQIKEAIREREVNGWSLDFRDHHSDYRKK